MATNTNRRRKLLVNAPVQNRIIRSISWPPALVLSFTTLVLCVYCRNLADEALMARVELPSLVPIFVTVISFLFVALGYVILNALKISNRIAGPMYRLRKTLEDVKAGDFTSRATLRDSDFLKVFADDLNEFLDWLEEHPPQGVATGSSAPAQPAVADDAGDETAESSVAGAPAADTTSA